MAVTRVITHYGLLVDKVYGFGYFDGLGSPNRISLNWLKHASGLTAGEQTDLASIISFINGYIGAEEAPTGYLKRTMWPVITTNAAGDTPTGADNQAGLSSAIDVSTTNAIWHGERGSVWIRVYRDGVNHSPLSPKSDLWRFSQWSKALAAFSAPQQTTLNSFTAALGAYIAADLPLPPWDP